jgi:uncharacterized membrane protein
VVHLTLDRSFAPVALLVVFALSAGCSDDAEHSNTSGAAGAAGMVMAGMAAASGVGGAAAVAGAAAGGGAGSSMSSGKLSFATDVYPKLIRPKCSACHNDAPSFGGLAYFPGDASFAYGNLVNVPAGAAENNLCKASGLMRVKPGDPEHSLMYLKLTMPPCGSKMPPAAFSQATQEQVDLVRQWIMDGAAP